MALANRRPSAATDDQFIPEVWSSKVIDHVRENLVSVNVVNTSWKTELAMGDKLYIPTMIVITGGDVDVTINTVTNATTTVTDYTGDEATITIDTWWEIPVIIDDSVKAQTQVGNLLETAASNAAFGLAKKIDTDVNTLFSYLGGYSGTTVYGSDGQTFTDDIMIALMEYLDENDVPRADRSLVFDPSSIADIYKIDKFVRLDYQKVSVVTTGNIGQIYGVPVYVTNNLLTYGIGSYGCLLHKDAIGLVIQDGPTVEKWRHHAAHADVVNVSALFGSDVLRATFGRPFYTRKY